MISASSMTPIASDKYDIIFYPFVLVNIFAPQRDRFLKHEEPLWHLPIQ